MEKEYPCLAEAITGIGGKPNRSLKAARGLADREFRRRSVAVAFRQLVSPHRRDANATRTPIR